MIGPAASILLALTLAATPHVAHPDDDLDGFDEVDAGHSYLSEGIGDAARWIDSFFVNERALAEENRSSWSISGNTSWEEGRGGEGALGNDLRILLPTLEKRAQIMFTSLSDNDPALNARRREGPSQSPDPTGQRQKSFTAGVGLFIDNVKERSVRVDAGASFIGVTPKVYTGLRYRVSAEWGPWEISFTERFSWYQETAFEAHTYVDLYRHKPGESLLRIGSEISMYDGKVGIYYGQTIAFTKIIDDRSAVTHEIFTWFSSNPYDKLDDVGMQGVYRRQLKGEWLWGEASGWIRFPRDRGFERTVGGMLKVQVEFGPKEKAHPAPAHTPSPVETGPMERPVIGE